MCADHVGAPEEAQRRLHAQEGTCAGWAHDAAEANAMAQRARKEGCLKVMVTPVERRVLPPKPKGVRYQNRPHEFAPSRYDCVFCHSCGKRYDDGPHEP